MIVAAVAPFSILIIISIIYIIGYLILKVINRLR